jgi:Resolvase, N terminal domain/Recombinase/Recombinase zinc beta ribbon domain
MTHVLEAFFGQLAVSYSRYSSPAQGLGGSLKRQIEATVSLCAMFGIILDEEMRDEGKSGWSGRHLKDGALGNFYRRVETGPVRAKLFIVEALDRMSRQQPLDAMHHFTGLLRAGIAIYTTMDGQLYTRASLKQNIGQLYMSLGMMAGANSESNHKSDRVKDSWKDRRSKITDLTPSWIRANANRDGFEVIPECQPVITLIFSLCTDGWGLDRIAAHLNKTKVPTFSTRKARGGWYDSYLRKMITERRILGEVELGTYDQPEEGGTAIRKLTGQTVTMYPAAISEAQWRAANDALTARRGSGGQQTARMVNLFSGLAVCQCGARMRVRVKGNRGNYTYLQCRDAKRGLCEHKQYWNYKPIEQRVLRSLATGIYAIPDQSEQQTVIQERIAIARREADVLAIEYREAHRIARRNPGTLADEGLAEAQTDHGAKMVEIEELERQSRRLGEAPQAERLADIRRSFETMDSLIGDARDTLRTKLNADFRRTFKSMIFRPDGRIVFSFDAGTEREILLVDQTPADADRLTTAEQVLAALGAGHQMGMAG